MEAIIKLKIYTVEHYSYGDSTEKIFEDTRNKEYNNYEEIQTDVCKLADATRKLINNTNKSGKQQEFDIYVSINNFQVAYYHSYVSRLDTHLKKGYSQGYKDWETVLNVVTKYGTKSKKSNISKIIVNRTKLNKDIVYRLQQFHDFVIANIGKSFRLKDNVYNDWYAWIEGFEFTKSGKILINCYWQGAKTDGNKYIEYNGNPIRFNVSEKTLRHDYNHRIEFSREQINEAILNLLLENCIIK